MNRTIAPQVHNFGPLHLTSPRVIRLHNGIHIYIETGSEADVNRLTIALPGGGAEEPVAGLASCTASLLAEGTNHYSGADIAARLEYAGAWTGTSVSTHHTSITLSSLNDKFAELLPLLIDIVFHPIFPAEATNGICAEGPQGSTSNAARCHFSQTKPYGRWPMAQVPPSPALNLQNRSSV